MRINFKPQNFSDFADRLFAAIAQSGFTPVENGVTQVEVSNIALWTAMAVPGNARTLIDNMYANNPRLSNYGHKTTVYTDTNCACYTQSPHTMLTPRNRPSFAQWQAYNVGVYDARRLVFQSNGIYFHIIIWQPQEQPLFRFVAGQAKAIVIEFGISLGWSGASAAWRSHDGMQAHGIMHPIMENIIQADIIFGTNQFRTGSPWLHIAIEEFNEVFTHMDMGFVEPLVPLVGASGAYFSSHIVANDSGAGVGITDQSNDSTFVGGKSSTLSLFGTVSGRYNETSLTSGTAISPENTTYGGSINFNGTWAGWLDVFPHMVHADIWDRLRTYRTGTKENWWVNRSSFIENSYTNGYSPAGQSLNDVLPNATLIQGKNYGIFTSNINADIPISSYPSNNAMPLPNTYTGVCPLFKIAGLTQNPANNTEYARAWFYPGARNVLMTGFNSRDTVTYGDDVYMFFPARCRIPGGLSRKFTADLAYAIRISD